MNLPRKGRLARLLRQRSEWEERVARSEVVRSAQEVQAASDAWEGAEAVFRQRTAECADQVRAGTTAPLARLAANSAAAACDARAAAQEHRQTVADAHETALAQWTQARYAERRAARLADRLVALERKRRPPP